jgi:hypothetical protein
MPTIPLLRKGFALNRPAAQESINRFFGMGWSYGACVDTLLPARFAGGLPLNRRLDRARPETVHKASVRGQLKNGTNNRGLNDLANVSAPPNPTSFLRTVFVRKTRDSPLCGPKMSASSVSILAMENRTTTKPAADASRSGIGVRRPFRIDILPINIDDLREMVSRPLVFSPKSENNFNTRREPSDYK